jgi:hypothetical protein
MTIAGSKQSLTGKHRDGKVTEAFAVWPPEPEVKPERRLADSER